MPKKLGDFLNSQALKAGIKADDKALIDLLSRQGLNDIELPDSFVDSIDNNLLSIEVARNGHPALKSAYYARAFAGVDAELNDLMTANEFDAETVAALKAETSSTKRMIALVNKVKELQAAKAGASAPDKVAIQNKINELNNELASTKQTIATLKAQHAAEINGIKVKGHLSTLLGKYKTVYDDLDPVAKNAAINALIEQQLQEKNAEFKFADNGAFDLRTKDGMNVFGPNNIQLTPDSFLDTTLAKILKQTATPNSGGSKIDSPNPAPGPQGQIGVSPSFAAAIQQSRQAFEASKRTA